MTYHNISAYVRTYDTIGLPTTDSKSRKGCNDYATNRKRLQITHYHDILSFGETDEQHNDRQQNVKRRGCSSNTWAINRFCFAPVTTGVTRWVQLGRNVAYLAIGSRRLSNSKERGYSHKSQEETQRTVTITAKNGYALSPEGTWIDRAGWKPPGNADRKSVV